jgi:sugar lactone lactonase YvrE
MRLRSVRALVAAALVWASAVGAVTVAELSGVANAATSDVTAITPITPPVEGTAPAIAETPACPSSAAVTPTLGTNLISNPDAVDTDTTATPVNAASWVAYPDCWTVESSASSVIMDSATFAGFDAQYGAPAFSSANLLPSYGTHFFIGGTGLNNPGAYTYGLQTIPLSSIGAAGQPFSLTANIGGFDGYGDTASVSVSFENASGGILLTTTAGPVTETERNGVTELIPQSAAGVVPAGSTQAVVEIEDLADHEGANYIDAMADNLDLTIGATPAVDPTPPVEGTAPTTEYTPPTCPVPVTPALNTNLIANPGAETTVPTTTATPPNATSSEAYPACWTVESSASTIAMESASYGESPSTPTAPSDAGSRLFFGGTGDNNPDVYTYGLQTINLSSIPNVAGQAFSLTALVGGNTTDDDWAAVIVNFENADGSLLSQPQVGPVTEATRAGTTELIPQATTGLVPSGTTQAVVEIEAYGDNSGANNDYGMADNLDLTVGSTVVGTSTVPFSAPAPDGGLYNPEGVAAYNGTVYVSNTKDNVVAAVSGGKTSIVAGSYEGYGEAGDGGQAVDARLYQPTGLAYDPTTGDLFIADTGDNAIREVDTSTGVITRYAGNGTAGDTGNGGPAASAELNQPQGLAVDAHGDLFITDADNNQVREVTPDGVIHDFAGNGTAGYRGDGGLAASAELDQPSGVAVDSDGNVFIADSANDVIRRVDAGTGDITTVAGNHTAGNTGNGGSATSAELDDPQGIAVDPAGDVFIADTFNSAIREVAPTGGIAAVLSSGLNSPYAVAVDPATGDVYTANTTESDVLETTGEAHTTPVGPGPTGSDLAPPVTVPESPSLILLPVAGAAVLLVGGWFVSRRRRTAHRAA